MISLNGLTKRYGDKIVVSDLSLSIKTGAVTGFLGPNGAGKSTTMRMIVGLDRPSAGSVTIGGLPYARITEPLRTIGALLDARAVHPGRSGHAHLVALARSNGIPLRRVAEVLETVGLGAAARKRAGALSLGMSQRLGIAAALLGDPGILMFDEPVNGLDTDGVRWVRGLMRSLADEGRTVFVSSHLMSEMQLTADHLVVIGKGRLIMDAPLTEVIARSSLTAVVARTPHAGELASRLTAAGIGVERLGENELVATGAAIERVGDIAHEAGVRLHELRTREASLEQAYQELTEGSVEYGART
ncbi:ATP-binding cassette domain-containing protein [Phytomonospora endophytica]|uniref:ABC-2 type transport system ATP-binding protein n=1 Tax=Phytomonospora endophytica TaxID=714109 RepID=A0A841FF72_9ACTN|nr:ATP-binding cassette domain-containing protein [Phytomonospora endophytica]MBB6032212.1 ABC-2 type transport system ATP-binding protein [Phytomonospora endophytica]GIG68561.1 multidrug ABC transporter ATP-binding protein [Phytomonospora endophytica]